VRPNADCHLPPPASRLKPAITKAELTQIAGLLSSLPQPVPMKNPILEAASARKELVALALDPIWAQTSDRARQSEVSPSLWAT